MYENLTLFQTASAFARHAEKRQALAAQNIANADTPGFKPRDLKDFAQSFREMQRQSGENGFSGHRTAFEAVQDERTAAAPNANAVSVETEMMRAVDIRLQHDTALAIYRSALGILRTSLGRQ